MSADNHLQLVVEYKLYDPHPTLSNLLVPFASTRLHARCINRHQKARCWCTEQRCLQFIPGKRVRWPPSLQRLCPEALSWTVLFRFVTFPGHLKIEQRCRVLLRGSSKRTVHRPLATMWNPSTAQQMLGLHRSRQLCTYCIKPAWSQLEMLFPSGVWPSLYFHK